LAGRVALAALDFCSARDSRLALPAERELLVGTRGRRVPVTLTVPARVPRLPAETERAVVAPVALERAPVARAELARGPRWRGAPRFWPIGTRIT